MRESIDFLLVLMVNKLRINNVTNQGIVHNWDDGKSNLKAFFNYVWPIGPKNPPNWRYFCLRNGR